MDAGVGKGRISQRDRRAALTPLPMDAGHLRTTYYVVDLCQEIVADPKKVILDPGPIVRVVNAESIVLY